MLTAQAKLLVDARDARAIAAKARRVAKSTPNGDSALLQRYAAQLEAKAAELERRAAETMRRQQSN